MTATLDTPTETDDAEESQDWKGECAICGCDIDESDACYLNGEGDCCPSCFNEHSHTCQLCEEDGLGEDDLSPFILVKTELANCMSRARFPGIYRRINRGAFMSVPMIGSPTVWAYEVAFVATLPKGDDHYDISGHICKACAPRYERIYKRVYEYAPQPRPVPFFSVDSHWPLEKKHTRRAVLRDRRALRNLETHIDPTWRHCRTSDLLSLYGLPRNLKTWSDWIALSYKSVTIYSLHRRTGDDLEGWLTLSPHPSYRNWGWWSRKLNEHLIFCASGLPTYPQKQREPDDTEWRYESRYEKAVKSRQAIIAAIDAGLLRQDGVYSPTGERLLCR